MAGKVIGKSMNFGFAGTYARTPDDVIFSRKVADDSADIVYGAAVALKSDNTYTAAGAGFTAAKFAGVALRVVKQALAYEDENESKYVAGDMMSVLQRGNVTVKCAVGTPTAGGDVYVRIAANASITAGVVGGFEASADGANTIKLDNAKWTTGDIDANGVVELTILNKVNP